MLFHVGWPEEVSKIRGQKAWVKTILGRGNKSKNPEAEVSSEG